MFLIASLNQASHRASTKQVLEGEGEVGLTLVDAQQLILRCDERAILRNMRKRKTLAVSASTLNIMCDRLYKHFAGFGKPASLVACLAGPFLKSRCR